MKVLFPLDGSDASWRAFRRGLEMLRAHPHLKVVAFNVRQPGFAGASPETVAEFDADEDDEVFPTQAASERCLAKARAIAGEIGVDVELKSVEGIPAEAILEESKGYDLIVVHALSKSNLKDFFKGSGTEKLVRHAPTSVMLVRE